MQLGRNPLCLLCKFTDMTSEVILRRPNKHIFILTNSEYGALDYTLLFIQLMLSVVCETYYKILKAWSNASVVLHLDAFLVILCEKCR